MRGVVKGSKQQRMVVVPYRPWFRYGVTILAGAGLLLTVAAGFFYGQFDAARDYEITSADNEQLLVELANVREEVLSLRSKVAISGRTSMMDRRANEEVQNTIGSLRQRVMQLEQDVMFYRQVMTPELAEPGLIIAEFTVLSVELPGRYRYKSVFRQAGAGDRVLEGRVQIDIAGTRDGEWVLLPLQTLVPEADSFDNSLNFRYFQNIEGDMLLPPGFHPVQVEIRAESTKPQQRKVEKLFSWAVVEA